jgi:hypothetical protein
MTIDTSIIITDPFGNKLKETKEFLEIGNNPGLHYVLACGQVGALTVTLPPEFNPLLLLDGRVHVMRSVDGAPAQREGESCFLIRRWDYAENYTTITAVHANDLMRRRNSVFASSTGNSTIAATVADLAIANTWDLNFTSSSFASLTRSWDNFTATNENTGVDISALVSRQAVVGIAPLVDKFIQWRNILEVFHEIEDTSTLQGTFLTAEIVAPTESTLELRIYTGQRGVDRRFSTGNGLLFTSARGNLENALLTLDRIEEITFAEAGGAGRDGVAGSGGVNARGLANGTAIDATRVAESPFNRIEVFVDSGNGTNAAGQLESDARYAVRAGRPVITAVGDLTETDQCIRGIHYNFGDLVTVEVRGIQYDMRLDLLDVTLSGGTERTIAKFQYNG